MKIKDTDDGEISLREHDHEKSMRKITHETDLKCQNSIDYIIL